MADDFVYNIVFGSAEEMTEWLQAVAEVVTALEGLTAGLKYLTPEQIAETPRDATAILDVPCGAVQDAFSALARIKEV